MPRYWIGHASVSEQSQPWRRRGCLFLFKWSLFRLPEQRSYRSSGKHYGSMEVETSSVPKMGLVAQKLTLAFGFSQRYLALSGTRLGEGVRANLVSDSLQ
jgi:hypothetical protein